MRELGRGADAAVGFVETHFQFAQRLVEQRRRHCAAVRDRRRSLRDSRAQGRVLFFDVVALAVISRRHLRHEVEKTGHAMARGLRKIRAAEKWRLIRHQKHRQRPAAVAPRQERVRRLINLVEIGTLFAVDFDIDEEFVHHRGDRRVLERLVRHHVTPVARRIADRQQYRLVLLARGGERLCRPTDTNRPGLSACCCRYGLVCRASRFDIRRSGKCAEFTPAARSSCGQDCRDGRRYSMRSIERTLISRTALARQICKVISLPAAPLAHKAW